MDEANQPAQENLAQTLERTVPAPVAIALSSTPELVGRIGVPPGWKIEVVDDEKQLDRPRRTKALATLNDAQSFIDFVLRYEKPGTTVWCSFNPQTFALAFNAVIDEHEATEPAWRSHTGIYVPDMSAEWKVWTRSNRTPMEQVLFAEFLEANEPDIAGVEGLPTSLELMKMATEFQSVGEVRIKSKVMLQSGGVALEYVNAENPDVVEKMRFYEKFAIGIPVFWRAPTPGEAIPAYRITTRLKYDRGPKPIFRYELVRPDLVHQRAAGELIAEIRAGIGEVPLVMGSST